LPYHRLANKASLGDIANHRAGDEHTLGDHAWRALIRDGRHHSWLVETAEQTAGGGRVALDRHSHLAFDARCRNARVLPLVIAAFRDLLANRRHGPTNGVRLVDHGGFINRTHHRIAALAG